MPGRQRGHSSHPTASLRTNAEMAPPSSEKTQALLTLNEWGRPVRYIEHSQPNHL
jgi:hypothetical protein